MCRKCLFGRGWQEIEAKTAEELERSHWLIFQIENTKNSIKRRERYEHELRHQLEYELEHRLENGELIDGMHLIALDMLSDSFDYILHHEGSC